jgi:hypothetical protein
MAEITDGFAVCEDVVVLEEWYLMYGLIKQVIRLDVRSMSCLLSIAIDRSDTADSSLRSFGIA